MCCMKSKALLLAVSSATAEIRPLGETVVMLMSGKRAEMEVETSSDGLIRATLHCFFYFMQLQDQAWVFITVSVTPISGWGEGTRYRALELLWGQKSQKRNIDHYNYDVWCQFASHNYHLLPPFRHPLTLRQAVTLWGGRISGFSSLESK